MARGYNKESTGKGVRTDRVRTVSYTHLEDEKPVNILNFIIPMASLIAVTLVTQELTYGLIVGIVLCFILYIAQKLITAAEAFDAICKGFEEMFVVTALVISAFVLQNANDELGLAPFVVNSVVNVISCLLYTS